VLIVGFVAYLAITRVDVQQVSRHASRARRPAAEDSVG
jgi:hypothetical protein